MVEGMGEEECSTAKAICREYCMVQKAMAASGLASGRSWLSDSGTGPVTPGSCTHAHGYNLTVILGRVIWLDNP